tara:strand:- start:6769 stop:7128 length:360 start_codon:yes stop_codon:yes gene_type:complete
MKLLIAGGRDYTATDDLIDAINSLIQSGDIIEKGLEIVSGMALGADTCAIEIAKLNNLPLRKFPANWALYGRSAGYRRNVDMAQYSDVLLAAWDGKSKGTKHMIDTMKKLDKPVFVLRY